MKLRSSPHSSIVGIDPTTGGTKFSIPLEQSISSGNGNCGEYTPYQQSSPASVRNGIIAGDGYAYFPYSYSIAPLGANQKICYQIDPPWQPDAITESYSGHVDTHFRVMRVGSDGSSQEISVKDGTADSSGYCINQAPYTGGAECSAGHFEDFQSVTASGGGGQLIGNADKGVLMSWSESSGSNPPLYHLSSIVNGAVAGTATTASSLTPVLQAQDGSFIGTGDAGMSAFDQYGNQKWSVPGFNPQIATSDGGVIATSFDGLSTVTFDQGGNATGQIASLLIQSRLGYAYAYGSVNQVAFVPMTLANTFADWPWAKISVFAPPTWVQLASCNDKTIAHPGPCPQPKDAIFTAWYYLKQRMTDSSRISNLDNYVFTRPGLHVAYDRGKFLNYLNLVAGPEFYDGEQSTVTEPDAKCPVSSFFTNITVRQDFQSSNKTRPCEVAAISCGLGSSQPQRTFFEPRAISIASGGPIDGNIALEFHEALHGFTGLLDPGLQTFLGCSQLDNTTNITLYLQQFIGAQPLQGQPIPCKTIENNLPTDLCVR